MAAGLTAVSMREIEPPPIWAAKLDVWRSCEKEKPNVRLVIVAYFRRSRQTAERKRSVEKQNDYTNAQKTTGVREKTGDRAKLPNEKCSVEEFEASVRKRTGKTVKGVWRRGMDGGSRESYL
ncbi:Hypothetical predicted protein [Pelobates cultripes]|uniref:Uncharacterized protein n=1 Tax=Pelobates cultripes TaxID=61616 RepID=A0AAD1TPB0_PELCU|nr:Hypothetical predicted protein [Pelobates cultripes]